MIKEFKYLFYTLVILFSIFFTVKFYFSDENVRNSFRASKLSELGEDKYSENLEVLNSDTNNIADYEENTLNKDKKKYKFLELLKINEK